ncbi:hypothetical protein L2725_09035 [Shewanella corallii]|uniref:Lipoprotein n=1 Tax=Shewanella corallii TaxID=560080 RepID=A0ABT0N657_9GAMM|nr:hypothetical protein [Shewanella corallii]MCL2913938.1 hypothetical protein [Shewanella corallii]
MNKSIMILTLCGLLTACGGGGGDEGEASPASAPAPAPASTPDTSTDNTSNTVTSTGDLAAPAGFDYHPAATQTVQVDISGYSTDRAYLSIYSQYHQLSDGDYLPVYDSRILSSPLAAGELTLDFTMVTDEGPVLAEIWFYDGSAPLVQVFERGESVWYW